MPTKTVTVHTTKKGYRAIGKARNYRKKKKVTIYRKPYKKVNPYNRLKGRAPMPYYKYQRCYDAAPMILSASTQTAAGFWCHSLHEEVNSVPGAANLLAIYRFFRIKQIICQYTPSMRSDEYSKIFYMPGGLTPTQPFQAGGGALEIKQLAWDGFLAHPNNWADCLNRAGKIQKCATTKPFIRKSYPKVQQVVQDLSGTDTQRAIKAPWLPTDVSSNLTMPHFVGYDCYHTLNDISYDQDKPLRINRRYVVTIEFKGLKI